MLVIYATCDGTSGYGGGAIFCGHGESLLTVSGMSKPTLLAVASIRSSAVRSIRGL